MRGKTEVIEGTQEIVDAITRFQAGTRKDWCACVESTLPAFSVGTVKEGYLAAQKRGVNIKYITEITPENLPYCRDIMDFAELRHLESVRGNFALSEAEYIAGVLEGGVMKVLVRSDVEELVRQQHLVFQTLWDNAVPAATRISGLA